ncbi:hypothetical protein DM02DRAFT_64447 [Periconia macrospinosa]|uniref:VWFD domain-containing protein n=1 Tax=Periconia macrospinosa TaxID=97972 RepID=A0A2V1DJR5_9PLEO|nr:hypothetical protein DM02DRAFT_64447 [Periconia macrospinosa]
MDFIVTSLALTALRTAVGTGTGTGPRDMATETPLFKNSSSFPTTLSSTSTLISSSTPTSQTRTIPGHLSSNSSSHVSPSGVPARATNATQSWASRAANTTSPPFLHLANFNVSSNATITSLNATATRAPNLNNATECWPHYWSWKQASSDWLDSHQETVTYTSRFFETIRTGYPPLPTVTGNASSGGNSSWTSYCDGLPRFTDMRDASKLAITLESPIVKTHIRTFWSVNPATDANPYTNTPSCQINGTSECSNIWNMFATSLSSSISSWSSRSVLTISVPATPTAVVVNGQSTPLITPAPGQQLPPLPILTSTYVPREDHAGSAWYIDDAYNFIGETTIVPGQEVTFTFNARETMEPPFGPNICPRPSRTLDVAACSRTQACTIKADHVELIYFPPPTSSRDICANTSPGFNSYSQSIYTQPHQSTVVNGTTFWADKAYVRYNTVSAYKMCDLGNGLGRTSVPFGSTYTNAYAEVQSTDVSSMCGFQMGDRGLIIGATPVPVNFADLQGPVPESAYQCLPRCRGSCSSIVQSEFLPNLAVPPQVRGLDPGWAQCVPYFEGTPDPPIALTAVPDFLTPTPTPPVPGGTPTNGQPGPSDPPSNPPNPPANNPPANNPPANNPPANNPPSNNPPSNSPPSNNPPSNNPPSSNPGSNNPGSNNPGSNNPGSSNNNPGSNNPGSSNNNPGSNNPGSSNNNPGSNSPSSNPGSSNPGSNSPSSPSPQGSSNNDPSRPGANQPSNTDQGLAVGAPTTINGVPVTAQPDGSITVTDPNGVEQTLRPGQSQISVNGHTVFVSPLGDRVVVDGQVHNISQQQSTTMRVADVPMTVNPDGSISVIAGGVRQTLQVGGPQITVDGRTVSLRPNGQIMVDGSTYTWTATPDGKISVARPDGSTSIVALSRQSGAPSGALGGASDAAEATATSSNSRSGEASSTARSSGATGISSSGPESPGQTGAQTGAAARLRVVNGGWIFHGSFFATIAILVLL